MGSHVPLSDAQLADLLEQPGCCGVEFSLDEPKSRLRSQLARQVLSAGITPVLFSSRGAAWRWPVGAGVGFQMAQVVIALESPLGYRLPKVAPQA